ncbi:hypothetical protein [Actinoplanes sp. ATCC 53533]|uniref:hypothetical protein n=1 Tax=Actinoplanes sp. ATCC 53533 TaxID=1288362 RepID=UPI001315247E|nr:hypothetical protein [Actinoplanes sp. ATCC 53533]
MTCTAAPADVQAEVRVQLLTPGEVCTDRDATNKSSTSNRDARFALAGDAPLRWT